MLIPIGVFLKYSDSYSSEATFSSVEAPSPFMRSDLIEGPSAGSANHLRTSPSACSQAFENSMPLLFTSNSAFAEAMPVKKFKFTVESLVMSTITEILDSTLAS